MSRPTRDLLVELFVEELPPKALKRLGEAFAAALTDGLRQARPGLGRSRWRPRSRRRAGSRSI